MGQMAQIDWYIRHPDKQGSYSVPERAKNLGFSGGPTVELQLGAGSSEAFRAENPSFGMKSIEGLPMQQGWYVCWVQGKDYLQDGTWKTRETLLPHPTHLKVCFHTPV